MPRELIVDAELFRTMLCCEKCPVFVEYCEGVDKKDCVERVIARSNGKVREFEIPDLTSVLTNLEYAAFNLCESASEISIRGIMDSTCPEASLLIAIRELKEIQKGESNHE